MGKCSEPVSYDTITQLVVRDVLAFFITDAVTLILALSGAVYVLCCKSTASRKPPTWVKLLFALIITVSVCQMSQDLVAIYLAKNHDPDTAYPKFWLRLYLISFVLISDGTSLVHWLFAVKYFELSLNFPLLIGQVAEDEISRTKKCIKWTTRALNIAFYSQMGILIFLYGLSAVTEISFRILVIFQAIGKLMSALLLIFAICRLRILIKRAGLPSLQARKKVMTLHTTLFTLVLLVQLCCDTMDYWLSGNTLDTKSCRTVEAIVYISHI